MRPLFYPRRIAVIGVSERADNFGRLIVENITRFDYAGDVFPVGPRGGTVCGRTIITAVDQLPQGIDLAVIITPAPTVPDVIDQCGHQGIPWVIVETGGFGELSENGEELGAELLRRARGWGIRVVGPNGLGVINMAAGFATPFVPLRRESLKQGTVAVLAQSGGVMYALVNLLSSNNIGISKAVSFGNKLDLDESDYLAHLIDDDATEIIILYLEGIKRGRRFIELAKQTTKPIIIQKVNRYPLTSQLARYHTEALATDDRVVDAAFHEAGIVRVDSYRAVIDAVKIFTLPPMRSNNLAIISRSGGVAISAADYAIESKFNLYPLSKRFLNRVQEKSGPKVIKRMNPLDLGDFFNFDFFVEVTEGILREGADGIFFQHGAATDKEVTGTLPLGEAFLRLSREHQKPIAVCLLADDRSTSHIKQFLNFPLFADPHDAMRALALSRDRYQRIKERDAQDSVSQFRLDEDAIRVLLTAADREKRPLLLAEALEVVRAAGIPCARFAVCRNLEDAVAQGAAIGYPLTLKMNCPSELHKSDIGAVLRNIADPSALQEAFARLSHQAKTQDFADGILLQEWISGGVEMILGGTVDDTFGPVGMLGFGGTYAELFADTVLRILPLTKKKVASMPADLRGYPLLTGVRGQAPLDRKQLEEALLKLSQLMVAFPEIKGIDLNPLFVLPQEQGVIAVDARILISK
jgi:acyl-CoA synthetase (NDP forming)